MSRCKDKPYSSPPTRLRKKPALDLPSSGLLAHPSLELMSDTAGYAVSPIAFTAIFHVEHQGFARNGGLASHRQPVLVTKLVGIS